MTDNEFILKRLRDPRLKFGEGLGIIADILTTSGATLILNDLDGYAPVRFSLHNPEVTLVVMTEADFTMLRNAAGQQYIGRIDAKGETHEP